MTPEMQAATALLHARQRINRALNVEGNFVGVNHALIFYAAKVAEDTATLLEVMAAGVPDI
jgi:hypothetical protein